MTRQITELASYTLNDEPAGYRIEIVTVPVNLPTNHPIRWPYDDRSFIVPNTHGSIWMEVYAGDEEIYIAHGDFAATEESVMCGSVHVWPQHRWKGIATTLYDLAEELFEKRVVPSPGHSDDAKAFWAARHTRQNSDSGSVGTAID